MIGCFFLPLTLLVILSCWMLFGLSTSISLVTSDFCIDPVNNTVVGFVSVLRPLRRAVRMEETPRAEGRDREMRCRRGVATVFPPTGTSSQCHAPLVCLVRCWRARSARRLAR